MQDEDPDVRYAASKIFSESDKSFESRAPEFAFFRGIQKACIFSPPLLITECFSSRVLPFLDGLAEKITSLALAVRQRKDRVETFLTNLEDERKIFEEEEQNAYAEICLTSQLMAVSILKLCDDSTKILPDGVHPLSTHVICLTDKILTTTLGILKDVSQSDAHDILQEVSRDGYLFPRFHSLLLWCSAVLYAMGGHGNEATIKKLSADILQFAGSSAHPCIVEALNTLALSEYRCSATADRLTRSCFLLQYVASVKGFEESPIKCDQQRNALFDLNSFT
jgi:hypothetical protein